MEMEMEMEMGMGMAMAAVVGEEYCAEGERELTVRKTSVFYPGDGFAAYDHRTGDLVFRVDTYALADRRQMLTRQLVLMDPHGVSILTVRRKVSASSSSSCFLLIFPYMIMIMIMIMMIVNYFLASFLSPIFSHHCLMVKSK